MQVFNKEKFHRNFSTKQTFVDEDAKRRHVYVLSVTKFVESIFYCEINIYRIASQFAFKW